MSAEALAKADRLTLKRSCGMLGMRIEI